MSPERRAIRIVLVTPAARGTRLGNRITAERWARLLHELGARVAVVEEWRGEPCELLVALHARKSASSVRRFRAARPTAPLVVVLTGTDLYAPRGLSRVARRSLALASRIVVLQAEARRALPLEWRRKSRVILQSARPHNGPVARRRGAFVVLAAAHLRAVKDPLLAARATRELPAHSRLVVEHFGGVLDARLGARARRESHANPRWQWRGDVPHAELLAHLRAARAFVQTSRSEGGSAALAEALVSGLPVLATRIPASVGMLGERHPGLFASGDRGGLARLLERLERDARFRARLVAASRRLAARHAPARESRAWRDLLAELGLASARTERRRTPR
ncbi:MAG: TIGR04348 family glycosyltransferase [Planctomycetes bacterium]|nr:TIGR04348 family glycosyltransferase [Planctomycetota bacterium]